MITNTYTPSFQHISWSTAIDSNITLCWASWRSISIFRYIQWPTVDSLRDNKELTATPAKMCVALLYQIQVITPRILKSEVTHFKSHIPVCNQGFGKPAERGNVYSINAYSVNNIYSHACVLWSYMGTRLDVDCYECSFKLNRFQWVSALPGISNQVLRFPCTTCIHT